MDSRLKKQVIAVTVSGIILVILIVLFVNKDMLLKDKKNRETVSAESVTEENSSGKIDYYAWKSDEDFFDSEETTLANKLLEEMYTLDLRVTSVERDLHIEVLGYDGSLQGGIEYTFEITGPDYEKSQVQNKEKNGYMVISNLTPGTYTVSLEPVEKYTVPAKALQVEVKDTAAHEEITDIKYKLTDSKDANRSLEDTMLVSASEYENKSAYKETGQCEGDNLIYGVDLTEDYGDVDFEAMYEAGIRFVMLRAGYRGASSGKLIIDSKLYDYARSAMVNGIEVGVYFYSQAVNELEAIEEASATLYAIDDLQISYPVVIRFDSAGGLGRADAIDTESRTKIAEAFLETVANAGYEAGFYASSNWLKTNLNTDSLKPYTLWMAEFIKTPTYDDMYFDMWQFSDKGTVPGIGKEVCLDLKYD